MDPLELIDLYGSDAVRMTLLRSATLGSDVPVAEKWIEGDRNFANKLWNISRFVLMNIGEDRPGGLPPAQYRKRADRWILSRLDATVAAVDEAMEGYDLARAAQLLRQFTWSEFADWYVEWSKGPLQSGPGDFADATKAVLHHVLSTALRLLHPFMPFVTEELYRALTDEPTVMTAAWPQADPGLQDRDAEEQMEFVMSVVAALRRFRADHKIEPGVRPTATALVEDQRLAAILQDEEERVRVLARWGDFRVHAGGRVQFPGQLGEARIVVPGAVIHVPLAGLLDLDAERARLRKEIDAFEGEADRARTKLANREFTSKAPEEVVETHRERLAETEDAISRLREALGDLGN
jgi:valyl-tRNA synthetase